MNKRYIQITRGCAMAMLAIGCSAALAGEPSLLAPVTAIHQDAIARAELPPVAEAATLSALGAATAISDDVLGAESAMARIEIGDVVVNDQNVTGVVEGNVASGNTNGHNSISDNAFAGAAGFATAIQNTGNNVLIQNSTIINVSTDR
jgi:hypothetical protein